MRARVSPRFLLALTAALAVGLGVLAALQLRWIGQWGAVEEARLRSALHAEAVALDAAVTAALADVAAAFAEVEVGDARAADSLAGRWRRWQRHPHADLVAEVLWVRPGPAPRLARLAPEAPALTPLPWPGALDAWRPYFAAFPDTLAIPARPFTYRFDDADAPADPLRLVLPVLPELGARALPVRFLLLRLDAAALRRRVVAPALRGGLLGGDAYDVLVTAPDGETAPLYRSAEALTRADLAAPDVAQPVGPASLGAVALTLLPAGRQLDVASAERVPHADGRWTLRAQHRSGSVGAAVAALQRRQLAVAFGVLVVLGAGAALLAVTAGQTRRLAERQLTFVAGVTHELRTPLAVIRSAGENLADGVVATPEGARRYGALVRDEGQWLTDLVEGVLALAGSDARARPHAPLDVEALVADALAQARPAFEAAGHAPAVEVADALPPLVGDAATLASALRNLLANAARHGAPPVTLTVAPAGDGVAFAVRDGGPGVAPSERRRVFEPFYRGRADAPGSGLGLALVRAVAEAHGGTADVRGATFTLTLPAASSLPDTPP